MIRKGIIIILSILALAALGSYVSSRITGNEGGVLEVGETWSWHPNRKSLGCDLHRRYFYIWYNDPKPDKGSTWGMRSGGAKHEFMGLKYVIHANSWGYRMIHVRISLWLVAMLSGAYPAVAFVRGPLRRRRRRRRGLCVRCAYDLTGNKSGVCPECGQAVSDAR